MGNLFSNHKYLYEKFVFFQPNFDFYISIIKNIITSDTKIKDDAINEIKKLKETYYKTWDKYDLNHFNKLDNDTIIDLINLRKICHLNMLKNVVIYMIVLLIN